MLGAENQAYFDETAAKEPTTLDRIAEDRLKLNELRKEKEKARQEFVKQKYLEQAWWAHGVNKQCHLYTHAHCFTLKEAAVVHAVHNVSLDFISLMPQRPR